MDGMSDLQRLEARTESLESALAHHQREYDLLNQVVIEQAQLVEKLTRRLTQLESTIQTVREQLPDDRDPAEEKPPHY